MKSYTIALLVITLSYCSGFVKDSKREDSRIKDYGPRLENIINKLSILANHSKKKNQQVHKLIADTVQRINSNMLQLQVDFLLPGDIRDGAVFQFKNSGNEPAILISPFLIDLFERRPSIVFSILIHEFQHSDSFFSNRKSFVQTRNNPLEKYLYELDAHHMEAVFIRDYLKEDKRFKLTQFEEFLLSSFLKDNLAMFSYGFYKFDMGIVFRLNDMTHSSMEKAEKYEELTKVVDSILKTDYEQYKEDWIKFNQTVPLYTMRSLYAQFVRDIETYPMSDEDIIRMSNFNLQKDKPDAYRKFLEIDAKLEQHYGNLKYISKIQEKYLIVD